MRTSLAKSRSFSSLVLFIVFLSSLTILLVPKSANASASYFPTPSGTTANLYIAPPLVQASYASSLGSAQTETFDGVKFPNANGAPCPSPLEIGTINVGSDCNYYSNDPYFGGATTTNPTVNSPGGTHSNYASSRTGGGTEITLINEVNYVGFWWSAGSGGNVVNFYDANHVEVATLNADQIYRFLAPGGTLQSVDGNSSYLANNYYGHPADPAFYDSSEPFSYVHVVAANNIKIKYMKYWTGGNGFEIDNITIANFEVDDASQIVDPSSVLIASLSVLKDDFVYSASTGGTVTGTLTQSVGFRRYGSQVVAVPSEGYRFVKWSDNNSTDPNRTDLALGVDISASAIFELKTSCQFAYTKLNSSNNSIFLNSDNTLIADYVLYGDDNSSGPIDMGFPVGESVTHSQIDIDVNGRIKISNESLEDSYLAILNTDFWTNQVGMGLYENNGTASFDMCSNNEGIISLGKTQIGGKSSFVITWYKIRLYGQSTPFSTFQIAIIKNDTGYTIVRNYEYIRPDDESLSSFSSNDWPAPSIFYGPDISDPYVTLKNEDFQGFKSTTAYPLFATDPEGAADLTSDSRVSTVLGRYVTTFPANQNWIDPQNAWNLTAANKSYVIGESVPSLTATASPSQGMTGAPACSVYANSDTGFTTALAINSSLSVGTYVIRCTGAAASGFDTPSLINATLTVTAGNPPPTTYTITSSASSNGQISITGQTTVTGGENQTYLFTPTSGYRVKRVLVDGVPSGRLSSYTFTDVQENHTISVEFERIPDPPSDPVTPTPTPSPTLSPTPTPSPSPSTSETPSSKPTPKPSSSRSNQPGISVPDGTVIITPTQIAELNLRKSATGNSANISISQLKSGQRVRVTVISKANLNTKVVNLTSVGIIKVTPGPIKPKASVNPAMIDIKPAPKVNKSNPSKAKISISGAKKNQRVRVTVKSK